MSEVDTDSNHFTPKYLFQVLNPLQPLADKDLTMSIAAVIGQAQEVTSKKYGLTSAALGVLTTFYAIYRAGNQPRAKTLKMAHSCTGATAARRTKELREASLLTYQLGTNKGVMLTTRGKLVVNAFHREIERQITRLY